MTASYDDQGNYIYPEGFDPDTGEWLEGFDDQREAWEKQYAEAHARWEAHSSSRSRPRRPRSRPARPRRTAAGSGVERRAAAARDSQRDGGSLASDEALQALREKLTGGGA